MEIYGCDGNPTFVSIIHSLSETESSYMHINSAQLSSANLLGIGEQLRGGWGRSLSAVRQAYTFLSLLAETRALSKPARAA